MRITKFKDSLAKNKKTAPMNYFIHVSPIEAFQLIDSMVSQLLKGDPNTTRLESHTDHGEYLSICVDDTHVIKHFEKMKSEYERNKMHAVAYERYIATASRFLESKKKKRPPKPVKK